MANIPNDTYVVKLTGTANPWATGTLNTYQSPPTYKSVNCSSSSLDQTNVCFTVTLSHGNVNYTLSFTGGVYSSSGGANGKGQITGGTVSGLPESDGTTDSWSADAN